MTLKPNKSFPNALYQWNTGEATSSILANVPRTYSLTIINPPNCSATSKVQVGMQHCDCDIFIPTAFTPNGDGKNDIWNPTATWNCILTKYLLRVYNRWGQMVFSTTDQTEGWDGNFHNDKSDIGTYFYNIYYIPKGGNQAGQEKGSLTLIQ